MKHGTSHNHNNNNNNNNPYPNKGSKRKQILQRVSGEMKKNTKT